MFLPGGGRGCDRRVGYVREGRAAPSRAPSDLTLRGSDARIARQDRQEKEEWREKRKKEREAAIERMKMKVSAPDPDMIICQTAKHELLTRRLMQRRSAL